MRTLTAPLACGAALVLGLTACNPIRQAQPEPPTSQSPAKAALPPDKTPDAPATTPSAQQAEGVTAGPVSTAYPVEGRNLKLVRNGDTLALQFDFYNGTQDPLSIDSFGLDAREQLMALVDLPRGTAYGPVGDSGADARVAASSDERIEPGGSVTVTAVFAAPPKEAKEMLVLLDGLLPVKVPITEGDLADSPVLRGGPADKPQTGPLLCRAGGPQTETFKLPSDVLFAFGSAQLSPVAKAALAALRNRVEAESGSVTVNGHTDSIGDNASNERLSQQRAAAVDQALRAGLGGEFSYADKGHGESEPVAPNTLPDGSDNPDGRAQNRRVEVEIKSGTQVKERTTDTSLSDAGLEVQVLGLQRMSGYVLASVKVTNPGSEPAKIDYDNSFTPHELTAGQVSLAGKSGTYDLCAFDPPTYFDFIGTLSQRFSPGKLDVIPAGAGVTLWGLFPAPPAATTSLQVQIGGYGERLPAEITQEG